MKINRLDAIRIIDRVTDRDDPYWENLTEDFYDELHDDWPTIKNVLEALGVTHEEYKKVTGHEIGN